MMSGSGVLSPDQLARVKAAAVVLLPGSSTSVPAAELPDFDDLLQHAALAVGGGGRALSAAIDSLPDQLTWESLSAFAEADTASFGDISLLAIGAYFMATSVLEGLGLPTGERRPASREQAVDELSTGILDAVFERGCPVRTLEDVAAAANAQ
jgi:hypothetical protein